MAVYLDMEPSVQEASTRLCCEIIINSVFTLPEPLPSASYCMLFCSSAVTTAYFTTVVSTGYEPRKKHIDVKFHHARSLIADDVVDVKYIETGFQKADILTKSLGSLKFIANRLVLFGE